MPRPNIDLSWLAQMLTPDPSSAPENPKFNPNDPKSLPLTSPSKWQTLIYPEQAALVNQANLQYGLKPTLAQQGFGITQGQLGQMADKYISSSGLTGDAAKATRDAFLAAGSNQLQSGLNPQYPNEVARGAGDFVRGVGPTTALGDVAKAGGYRFGAEAEQSAAENLLKNVQPLLNQTAVNTAATGTLASGGGLAVQPTLNQTAANVARTGLIGSEGSLARQPDINSALAYNAKYLDPAKLETELYSTIHPGFAGAGLKMGSFDPNTGTMNTVANPLVPLQTQLMGQALGSQFSMPELPKISSGTIALPLPKTQGSVPTVFQQPVATNPPVTSTSAPVRALPPVYQMNADVGFQNIGSLLQNYALFAQAPVTNAPTTNAPVTSPLGYRIPTTPDQPGRLTEILKWLLTSH